MQIPKLQVLIEAGAVRNIATFYESIVTGNCQNLTVARSVDGTLATILAREAALRRDPNDRRVVAIEQGNASAPRDAAVLVASIVAGASIVA